MDFPPYNVFLFFFSTFQSRHARQFHQAIYTLNQKSSDLKRWEMIPQGEQLEFAYKVENYIFKYEPLYVARGKTPQFDEMFIGYGMTRNTQACVEISCQLSVVSCQLSVVSWPPQTILFRIKVK